MNKISKLKDPILAIFIIVLFWGVISLGSYAVAAYVIAKIVKAVWR